MTGFRIPAFGGMKPRIQPRLLAAGQAQEATNCKVVEGQLVPIRAPRLRHVFQSSGTIKSIFPLFSGATAYWLGFTGEVDISLGPIAQDTTQQTYYTGAGEPRVTNFDLATDGGTQYPVQWFVLGVTPPTTAPSVTPGSGSGVSRSYRYTFVNAWGEESAPSPASAVATGGTGSAWALAGMQTTVANSFSVTAATWTGGTATVTVSSTFGTRVGEYITVASMQPSTWNATNAVITAITSTTISYALTTSPGTYLTGGTVTRDAPHNNATWKQRIYRTLDGVFSFVNEQTAAATFNDSIADADLGDPLETQYDEMPPADLAGLIFHPSGMAFGFSGKSVYVSQADKPWAWPSRYRTNLPNTVTGIGVFGITVVAGTERWPVYITGTAPDAMSATHMDTHSYACIAKRSMVSGQGAVFYASPEGLVRAGPEGVDLFTRDTYTPEQWADLIPATMIASVYRDQYMVAYTNDEGAAILAIPLVETGLGVVKHEQSATAMLFDQKANGLHFVFENGVYLFDDPDGLRLSQSWHSKDHVLPAPENYGRGKLEALFTLTQAEIEAAEEAYDAAVACNAIIIGQTPVDRDGVL